MKTLEPVRSFFKDKDMVADDKKHTITDLMQHLSPIAALQQANAEKLEKAKEMLGSNWILHKDNAVTRKGLDK